MLENHIHKHYNPAEYNIAFKVLKEMKPELRNFLDYHVHTLEHNISYRKKKQAYNQLDEYLRTHRHLLGDTLTNMYANITICLYDIHFPNERTNKLSQQILRDTE